MAILSIQSQVVSGYVGNAAAVFALQRRGHEVWPLPTILLSHHPGHGGAQGRATAAALLADLLDGLQSRGCFARCEAVISGYLGQADQADIIRQAVARAQTGGHKSVYLCDPVLGDDSRTYVSHDVVTELHNLAALADIITPNAYELSLLSGRVFTTLPEALDALRRVQRQGPGIVVLTGFIGQDTPDAALDVLAVDGAKAWRLRLPHLPQKFSGAGDVFAALFLSFWLTARDTGNALGKACSALHGVLAATAALGGDELALIEAQNLLLRPAQKFIAERLA
jgi:pyridoxine kinase